MKIIKTYYLISTAIVGMLMFLDGFGGITRQQAGIDVMNHLGYPVYLLTIVGIAKILGTIALVQNRYKAIKEWAYAGFAINFYGAFMSRIFAGDTLFEIILPVIMLCILLVPYFLWKMYEKARTVSEKQDSVDLEIINNKLKMQHAVNVNK